MKNRIYTLISKGDLDIAVKEILKCTQELDNPKFHQKAIFISAKWEKLQDEILTGTSSHEERNVSQAQITNALLSLAESLPNKTNNNSKSFSKGNWAKLGGSIVLFISVLAGLAEFSGFSLRDLFSSQSLDSFSVSVVVHGKEGRDEKIITNGKVILDVGGNRIEEEINSQGEAIFPGLRKEYIGKSVFISIDHPQSYYPTNRNKEYILKREQSIYLEVALSGINRIWGKVMDLEKGEILDSVRVSVRNAYTYTDKYGKYELSIPDSLQDEIIEVQYFKQGYLVYFKDVSPHLKPDVSISLKRSSQ